MKHEVHGTSINGNPNLPQPVSPDLGGQSGSPRQWTVTYDNTQGNAAVKTLLGDFTGVIGDKLGIQPLPNTVTVDGTFGSTTPAIIKLWTVGMPVGMKGLHIQADDSSFFAQGKMRVLAADIENQAPQERPVNFATDVTGDTYNDKIREKKNFRFLLSARTAIYFEIPAGRKVTVTFNLFMQGDSYLFLPL